MFISDIFLIVQSLVVAINGLGNIKTPTSLLQKPEPEWFQYEVQSIFIPSDLHQIALNFLNFLQNRTEVCL